MASGQAGPGSGSNFSARPGLLLGSACYIGPSYKLGSIEPGRRAQYSWLGSTRPSRAEHKSQLGPARFGPVHVLRKRTLSSPYNVRRSNEYF